MKMRGQGFRGMILQMIFGGVLLAVFLHFGWISQAKPFWDNAIGGIIVTAGSRFLAFIFG